MEAAKSLSSSFTGRLAVATALSGLMLAAAVALWPQLAFWQQQRLATRLIAGLSQSPNPEINKVLKQVSALGLPAIEPLVMATTAQRADIALAARRIVEEQLASWKIRASSQEQFALAEPTELLARALAAHVEEFGPFGQQWATRLTLDIVDMAGSFSVAEAVPVLADCSAVLSAVPALGPRMLTPQPLTADTDSSHIAAALPEVKLPALAREPRSPGPVEPPATPAENSPRSTTTSTSAVAAQVPTLPMPLPRHSDWVPEWSGRQPSLAVTAESVPRADGVMPTAPGELIEVPSPDEMAALAASLRPQATRALLLRLRDANQFAAAAIREMLAERGIAPAELAVAVRLLAEDPSERIKLIDDLKVLPARTARRWLRELLADEDAEVRLTALTALATTNDPELVTIARDLAVRDSDRRVTELASQIMRQQR